LNLEYISWFHYNFQIYFYIFYIVYEMYSKKWF
jgi:hypothetical protein